MSQVVKRYHDFCAGHTVTGHESKCKHIHGHNYRCHFHVRAKSGELDDVGRVVDFSVVKERLCEWLEENWDHKFLIWYKDPRYKAMNQLDPDSLVSCQFNPTAENMAQFLVDVVGPMMLCGTGMELFKVELEETRKCSVECEVEK